MREAYSDGRIVIKLSIAKKLLERGYKIINIFPQRQENGAMDYTRCVFLFANEGNLEEDIKLLSKVY